MRLALRGCLLYTCHSAWLAVPVRAHVELKEAVKGREILRGNISAAQGSCRARFQVTPSILSPCRNSPIGCVWQQAKFYKQDAVGQGLA